MKNILFLLSIILFYHCGYAQRPGPDSLFTLAREEAFVSKDYTKAIAYSREALQQAPAYTDIRVFLSRVYLWKGQKDSARIESLIAVRLDSAHEEAAITAAQIAHEDKNYVDAYNIAAEGYQRNPKSGRLLSLMATVLMDTKEFGFASVLVERLRELNPADPVLINLGARLLDYRTPHRLGISYTHTRFSEQFVDPWSLVSVEYTRRTGIGPFTARINYANRFSQDGFQFEAEAYPRINKRFYTYIAAAFSADSAVFPNWRGGASLFANFNKGWEADAGARYLQFYGDDTWVLTGALGKYIRQYWFSLRSYITVNQEHPPVVVALNTRRYLKGADHFIGLNLSSGISPDNRSQAVLLGSKTKLKTQQAEVIYRKSFGMNTLQFGAGCARIEYLKDTYNDQLTGSISYQRRF